LGAVQKNSPCVVASLTGRQELPPRGLRSRGTLTAWAKALTGASRKGRQIDPNAFSLAWDGNDPASRTETGRRTLLRPNCALPSADCEGQTFSALST